MAAAKNYYAGHVWIGLYDDINSWRWSLEKEGYYGEGEFRIWAENQPNNLKGDQACAGMNTEGLWNDLPCHLKKQFVCYNGKKNTL